MKLGKLHESFTSENNTFLNLYQQVDLMECMTLDEIKSSIKEVLQEADNYAESNNLKFKYFDLAKSPLWEGLEVKERHFILKGFDAYIKIDLVESLDDIKPYVIVINTESNDKTSGQIFEINDEFVNSLNKLQREIFLEQMQKLEDETVQVLKEVWNIERKRIRKWITTSKVDLKGK